MLNKKKPKKKKRKTSAFALACSLRWSHKVAKSSLWLKL